MKHRIGLKIWAFFSLLALSLIIIISLLFIELFSSYSMSVHKEDLQRRGEAISQYLKDYFVEEPIENGGMGKNRNTNTSGRSGYGGFLRYLSEGNTEDIWVVDKDSQVITYGKEQETKAIDGLDVNAEELIQEVLKGEIVINESFSQELNTQTLTVGVPIKDDNGVVLGAVLLHSSINSIEASTIAGMKILAISMSIALGLAAILSFFFSKRFTKPLYKMKQTAELMSEGNYQVRTQINKKDEIGDLAKSIDSLGEDLAEAKAEREALEIMRKEFLANVSHELRTPVTIIKGSSEALKDHVIKDENKIQVYQEQIFFESTQLEHLINDLLELSKLQSPNFIIQKEKIDLKSLFLQVQQSFIPLAENKGIEVQFTDLVEPVAFEGDYHRLHQMLLNILSNSLKASQRNSTIIFKAEKRSQSVVLTIEDNGMGIAQEELPFLFERYKKGEFRGNESGSGLGLPIVKAIADKHGITIDVTSTLGKGTQFTFTFNL